MHVYSLPQCDSDGVHYIRDLLIPAAHLPVTVAKLLRPGGVRAVAAESLPLKQQFIVSSRARRLASTPTSLDRFVLDI